VYKKKTKRRIAMKKWEEKRKEFMKQREDRR